MTLKLDYETLYGLLDAAYAQVRQDHAAWGEGGREAWQRGRQALLEEHGWTEAAFYAELDARRR